MQKIFDKAESFSGVYPRKFIKFPTEWSQESWEPGSIQIGHGTEYLVPFVLDVGPKGFDYSTLVEVEDKDMGEVWKKYCIISIIIACIILPPAIYFLW